MLETSIASARTMRLTRLSRVSVFRKSIDLYLARADAAQRVSVQCDAMDNAVTYGFLAVGSVAILGATLAFLVW